MKKTPFPTRIGALVLALGLLGLTNGAMGQGKADIGKPSFDALPSPDVNVGKSKAFKPKDWLEIEVGITLPAQNREQKEIGFVNSVLVKWYVAMKDKASKKIVLLNKDVNHINVPVDEEFYASVYLSPNTLKRLTGGSSGGKGDVEAIGVEVFVDGVKVGEESVKQKAGWWKSSSSLGRGDAFPLLNKNETPFKPFWWDRYAEIEERR